MLLYMTCTHVTYVVVLTTIEYSRLTHAHVPALCAIQRRYSNRCGLVIERLEQDT